MQNLLKRQKEHSIQEPVHYKSHSHTRTCLTLKKVTLCGWLTFLVELIWNQLGIDNIISRYSHMNVSLSEIRSRLFELFMQQLLDFCAEAFDRFEWITGDIFWSS